MDHNQNVQGVNSRTALPEQLFPNNLLGVSEWGSRYVLVGSGGILYNEATCHGRLSTMK